MISDLGSSNHTPAPFLYDLAYTIAGSMTIPLIYYTEKVLASLRKRYKLGEQHYSRLLFRLSSFTFLFSFIGNFAYIGVGIFSADHNYNLI